jgi:hypothetical protein
MKHLPSFVALTIAVLLSACTTADTTASSNNQATPAISTDQAPRQRYLVIVTHVKPEMAPQFREFYQKETTPAQQKGGVKQQSVWTTANLGEGFEYVTIRPIEGLQLFDEPNALTKALGEEGVRKWAAKRATMIVSSRSYIMQARPEMSIAPNPNEAPKLAFVVRQSIAPGRSTDYENYVKTDVLPILKKTNPKGFLMNKVGTGGDTEEYISAALMDSFADYEKWTAALTKEGYANVVSKRAGIMMHRESAVYRYVPELSLPQPATQAAK